MKRLHYSIIAILTIAGSISVVVIIYHHYEKPILISKQKAFDIALQGSQCTQGTYRLNSTTIIGQLFHIKDNTVFFTNDKDVQDLSLASNFLSNTIKSSEYVWEITWDCYDATEGQYLLSSEHEQHVRFVDAKNGSLLK